jgi:uncharacterized protein (TIGR02118 family)
VVDGQLVAAVDFVVRDVCTHAGDSLSAGADRNGYESITGTRAPYPSLMIKLTVSYPKGEGTTFDHNYYAATHVPLCNSTFSPVKTEIEKGIDGPSVAGVVFYFDSMEAMQSALGSPQVADVMADVANYTNIAPVMQISEVVS